MNSTTIKPTVARLASGEVRGHADSDTAQSRLRRGTASPAALALAAISVIGAAGGLSACLSENARALRSTAANGETGADGGLVLIDDSIPTPDDAGPAARIKIPVTQGRSGDWFTYDDGTGGGVISPGTGPGFHYTTIMPPRATDGGGPTITSAACVTGSGFTNWGAGMGFSFDLVPTAHGGPPLALLPYDASAYTGLTFWAAAPNVAAGSVAVSVLFPDIDTFGEDPFSTCNLTTTKCDDDYGASVDVGSTWAQYTIRFADLTQGGWGYAAPSFAANEVLAVLFQVGPDAPFDLCVTDVYFTTK
jgi:hypothetical protein